MLLLRWLILTHPIFRSMILIGFLGLLIGFPWLPRGIEEWGSFIAFGFNQAIAASFISAGVILLLSIPFYFFGNHHNPSSTSRIGLLNGYRFVLKWIWPHRVFSLIVLILGFIYFADLSESQAQIVFGLTLVSFFYYQRSADSVTLGLNFLRFIECGIILIVSAGLGFVVYAHAYLVMLSGDSPKDLSSAQARLQSFLMIFCAAVQVLYQEYLARKLSRMERVVRASPGPL